MGQVAQILLVRIPALLLVALFLLASCKVEQQGRVDAAQYDSFWLWAGVDPQPVLDKAKSVYVLEGEVTGAPARFTSLRPAAPRIKGPEIWMVVRAETLDWSPETYAQILSALSRWRAGGANVVGIQIDFDAATRGLSDYAAFLSNLRTRLPNEARLSVTGLLDWSANGDPVGLTQLSDIVDEIVIQTYQGRSTIVGYDKYLARLKGFPIPFRIGLVQQGEWHAPEGLTANPNFRGYVVFLLNPQR